MVVYREVGLIGEDEGVNEKYGIDALDPLTGVRFLIGVYESKDDARRHGEYLAKIEKSIMYPHIVRWVRENYERYDWVVSKDREELGSK